MAGSSSAPAWDFLSHAETEFEHVELLRQMLQFLRYDQPPIFRGRRTLVQGHESWIMEAFIYAREGALSPIIAPTVHPRGRRSDAVQDAAQLASARLMLQHGLELAQTPFCFFPILYTGGPVPEYPDPVDDPRLTHQVQLTQAMVNAYGRALQEIGQLRALLSTSYLHADVLQSQLTGMDTALAISERDRMAAERELERLRAQADYTPSSPTYTPASPERVPAPLPPPAAAAVAAAAVSAASAASTTAVAAVAVTAPPPAPPAAADSAAPALLAPVPVPLPASRILPLPAPTVRGAAPTPLPGLRTRLTTRKSTRPPPGYQTADASGTGRGRRLTRSPTRSRSRTDTDSGSPHFSRSRSRSPIDLD